MSFNYQAPHNLNLGVSSLFILGSTSDRWTSTPLKWCPNLIAQTFKGDLNSLTSSAPFLNQTSPETTLRVHLTAFRETALVSRIAR